MTRTLFILGATTFLTACSSGGEIVSSGLLDDSGQFLTPLTEARGGDAAFAGTTNGYAYQVGMNASRSQFVTEAVLLDGTNLATPTAPGTAEMTAAYELETFQFPVTDANGLTGTRRAQSGDMTLLVDFENGAISGTDQGLSLDGTFGATGQIAGTATLEDMSGSFAGDVSNTQAIGIFNGQSVTGVFAGGLLAEVSP